MTEDVDTTRFNEQMNEVWEPPAPRTEWVVCYHTEHGGETLFTRQALEKVWSAKGWVEGRNPEKSSVLKSTEKEQ